MVQVREKSDFGYRVNSSLSKIILENPEALQKVNQLMNQLK